MLNDDLELLARQAAAGSKEALEKICGIPDLSRVFYDAYNSARAKFEDSFQLIHHEDGRNVWQEFRVILTRKITGYRGESKFSTWVWRIAYNTALEYFHRKQDALVIDSNRSPSIVAREWLNKQIENGRKHARKIKEKDLIAAAIRRVNYRYRKVLLLYMQENPLTIEEIARRLGISRSSAHRYLQLGMKELEDNVRYLLQLEGDE